MAPSRFPQPSSERTYWVRVMHFSVVVGLSVAVAAGLAAGLALLPDAVQTTTARVWIGIGLFGIVMAALAGIALYALHFLAAAPHDDLRRRS
jgi:hypothetical protein